MSLVSRILSALSALFRKAPRYEVSAYRTLYDALVTRLARQGVVVGSTARVPRVEIHTIREMERLDKEGALRQVNFIVESISNKSLGNAVTMNEDNLRLLTEEELTLDGWTCLGIIPVQLQDLIETSDSNKILYRILQECTTWLEKAKTDPAEEAGDPDGPIPEDPLMPPDPPEPEVDPEHEENE